jgi:hypothetical protein
MRSAFVLLLLLLWLIKARGGERFFLLSAVIGSIWLEIHRCEIIAINGARMYKSAIVKRECALQNRTKERMHIANDQKLGRFNVSLPLR